MTDDHEFVTIDMPLTFEIMFMLQADVGATREELELLEDLKWVMRRWHDYQHSYLPITLRNIWEMAADPTSYVGAMQYRFLGPLAPDEQTMLNGIFRLFAPKSPSDIRINPDNVFFHGKRIGWTNSDMLLGIRDVMSAMFTHERLSISGADAMPLEGLVAKLDSGEYCDQLWKIDPIGITPAARSLALEFFHSLEAWVRYQAPTV
jgi:hypothetical protein